LAPHAGVASERDPLRAQVRLFALLSSAAPQCAARRLATYVETWARPLLHGIARRLRAIAAARPARACQMRTPRDRSRRLASGGLLAPCGQSRDGRCEDMSGPAFGQVCADRVVARLRAAGPSIIDDASPFSDAGPLLRERGAVDAGLGSFSSLSLVHSSYRTSRQGDGGHPAQAEARYEVAINAPATRVEYDVPYTSRATRIAPDSGHD